MTERKSLIPAPDDDPRPGYMDDDYDEIVTCDNEASEQVADRLAGEKCGICGKGFADDREDYYRHPTGEPVHMTCADRMWEQ